MDKSRREVLKKLEERLDYRFRDVDLLVTALTHRSYVNENRQPGVSDNERLEFLGDSVLGLCVSDLLIKKYVDGSEGDLTKMRSVLVGEKNLAQLARELQIGNCLLIGRGEENAGSRARDSFLANAFEAVVAAVYLDSGYENVRAVVRKLIEPFLRKRLYRPIISIIKPCCRSSARENSKQFQCICLPIHPVRSMPRFLR